MTSDFGFIEVMKSAKGFFGVPCPADGTLMRRVKTVVCGEAIREESHIVFQCGECDFRWTQMFDGSIRMTEVGD